MEGSRQGVLLLKTDPRKMQLYSQCEPLLKQRIPSLALSSAQGTQKLQRFLLVCPVRFHVMAAIHTDLEILVPLLLRKLFP